MTNPNIHLHIGVRGRFKVDVLGPGKEVRRSTGWFDNLILRNGLNLIGSTGGVLNFCHVGVGNDAPNEGQTKLIGFVAATSNRIASSINAQSTPPYYGSSVTTWQFTPQALGNSAHNLSEIGVGPEEGINRDPSSPSFNQYYGNLFSRQLILDGSGNPTTITVLEDEYLNVTYELRYYPPLVDVSGSTVINGTTYGVTVRASAVTNANYWGNVIGSKAGYNNAMNTNGWRDGVVSTIDSEPSGNQLGVIVQSNSNYVLDSYLVDMTCSSVINASLIGIKSYFMGTTLGSMQIGISPSIDKSNIQQLTFVTRVSWGRHTLP